MLVLGLNGWPEGGHDASAVLLRDGVPIVMHEEERITRRKYAENVVPSASIEACLRHAGVSWNDLGAVAFGFDVARIYQDLGRPMPATLEDVLLPSIARERRTPLAVRPVPHHLAHAASGFWSSPFSQAAIVVVDGIGESVSTTIARGDERGITILKQIGVHASLGFFYDTATRAAGFRITDCGKLMGLAPYGGAQVKIPAFELLEDGFDLPSAAEIDRTGTRRLDEDDPVQTWWDAAYRGVLEPSVAPFENRDFAATVQEELERVLLHVVRVAVEMTGERRVVLAGGVALNCTANGLIRRSGLVDALFVPPVAGDTGVSLGAALALHHAAGSSANRWEMRHAYLGPSFPPPRTLTTTAGRALEGRRLEGGELIDSVARLLADGKVVAWFQGRAEVGPRALGARSILADPRAAELRDRVNQIKGRESWRPLAPSVAAEDFGRFFEGAENSPFMLLALPVREEQRQVVPAVVHVDGSARPQSVCREVNPRFWSLLRAFDGLTGVPVLLNTSFNTAGEPIVHSPEDAIRTFDDSDLDVLVLGDHVLVK
jgi:carbamoyltransferase